MAALPPAKIAEALGPTSLLSKNTPRMLSELVTSQPRMVPTIRSECRAVLLGCEGAALPAFATIVERLSLHYPESRLTAGEAKLVNEDWWRLLGDVPPDLLRLAADRWLMSTARFFPTPGQLKASISNEIAIRNILQRRAEETLTLLQDAVQEAQGSSGTGEEAGSGATP